MFGSSYGLGPLQANSFSGGIGDIQDALLQVNSQPGLPGMPQATGALDPVGTVEEEEDELQRITKALSGGDGMVGKTLRGESIAGSLGHMIMGNPLGGAMGGSGGMAGMLGGLFG